MVDFMVNFDFFAWYNGPIYEVFFVHQKGDDRMIINCETYEHILKHEVMDQYSNIPNTNIYIYIQSLLYHPFSEKPGHVSSGEFGKKATDRG